MKLLLDTHVFIWWDSEPAKLSPRALSLCQDSDSQLYLSVASLWEIQIKSHLRKLRLSTPLPDIVATQQEANGLGALGYDSVRRSRYPKSVASSACAKTMHWKT